MIKLKEVIEELDEDVYFNIEEKLKKNKAENFLHLFTNYRTNISCDEDIIKHLKISKNSFYVLKSRLYEKIQEHLTGEVVQKSDDVLKQMQLIDEKCFNSPRASGIAFLLKLEKELLQFDMHYELRIVYNALKKMFLYSDKYFHYSQLYNKQIALGISLEKCEELLGEFNRILGQYHFSRSNSNIEQLLFLKKEITNHYQLNPSRQISFIINLVELQLIVFCKQNSGSNSNILEIFKNIETILKELPQSCVYKNRQLLVDYLSFEYYLNSGDLISAKIYYEKVNPDIEKLMLLTSMCNTSRFLLSKIIYLQRVNQTKVLIKEKEIVFYHDEEDTHSKVLIGIYYAICDFYGSDTKNAIKLLTQLINLYSFKDYFHINLEIKLTLAFFNIQIKEYDRASVILNGISRKIKSEKIEDYNNLLNLIKLFNKTIENHNGSVSQSQKDIYTIFIARNSSGKEILQHLISELNLKYS